MSIANTVHGMFKNFIIKRHGCWKVEVAAASNPSMTSQLRWESVRRAEDCAETTLVPEAASGDAKSPESLGLLNSALKQGKWL